MNSTDVKKVIKNSGGQDFSLQVIFYMERNKELGIHDMPSTPPPHLLGCCL